MSTHDVAVIGLGIMGAATAWELSARGARVLALDANGPTHVGGSSHGATRIFRKAYWEGADYVPLLNRADAGWHALQNEAAEYLIVGTGGLFIGPRGTDVVSGSVATAVEYSIPHERLESSEIARRFPRFRMTDEVDALYEPGAYVVLADKARLEMVNAAVRNGAKVVYGEPVVRVGRAAGSFEVEAASGEIYCVKKVVIATGPWNKLVSSIDSFVIPCRVPVFWFRDRDSSLTAMPGRLTAPAFLVERPDGRILYGAPEIVDGAPGIKLGFHNHQQFPANPNRPAPEFSKEVTSEIATAAAECFVGLDAKPAEKRWCFYTMSPDTRFVLGECSDEPGLFYISACSGHGFKFAPGVASVIASMALEESEDIDVSSFSARRFDGGALTPNR